MSNLSEDSIELAGKILLWIGKRIGPAEAMRLASDQYKLAQVIEDHRKAQHMPDLNLWNTKDGLPPF